MGSFIGGTLVQAYRYRSFRLQLSLSILAIVFFLGLMSHRSREEFGTSLKNLRRGHQALIYSEPRGVGESRLGIHPHLRPDSAPKDAKANGGPSILNEADVSSLNQVSQQISLSKSHHIVNGLEVYPPPPPADEDEYVAMCLLVKDVAVELREFFTHYYYHHGLRRFYLYDDGSNPPLSTHPGLDNYNVPEEVLNFTYIPPETVPADEREHLQDKIMEKCVKEHGHKHHWIGLLDPDEYLEMRHSQYPVLLDWLRFWEYDFERKDNVGGLAISWLPHNSAGLDEIPTTGFRQAYTTCVSHGGPDFWLIQHSKSFIRPQFLDSIPYIHGVNFNNDSMIRFGEQQDESPYVTRTPNTHEYWALHHYGTGSRKYFEYKARKGRSQGPGKWPVDEKYWDWYHANVRTYQCNEMQRFVP